MVVSSSEDVRLVDAAVVAGVLGVSKGWVMDAARADRIPHRHVGPKFVRFDLNEVRLWIAEGMEGGWR